MRTARQQNVCLCSSPLRTADHRTGLPGGGRGLHHSTDRPQHLRHGGRAAAGGLRGGALLPMRQLLGTWRVNLTWPGHYSQVTTDLAIPIISSSTFHLGIVDVIVIYFILSSTELWLRFHHHRHRHFYFIKEAAGGHTVFLSTGCRGGAGVQSGHLPVGRHRRHTYSSADRVLTASPQHTSLSRG